jgi:hypothetical protein
MTNLNLRDLRTVRFERVDWFEQNLIPRAELTLVNGDGGLGKTTAVLDLIARASVGSALPSGLQHSRPLRCLIVAEEDRHGLLRARLDVAGADHDHIRLVESVGEEREYLTFPQHTRALRDAIVSGGWDVVLIDALLNHLDDDINASKPQDMRRAARSLSDVTHETGATIVAVRHIGKAAGAASTRGFGSAEARNVCRSELTVGGHPDADGLIVIALSKANLSPDRSATMAFRLVSQHVRDDDGIETSIARVEWEAAPPKITADALLDKQQPAERSQSEAARDWLRELLGDGRRQRPADVMLEAKKAGFSDATIYRVRARAGIVSDLSGFPARAYWFLNEPMDSHVSQHGGLENPGKAENPCRPDGLWSEGESRLSEAVEWP